MKPRPELDALIKQYRETVAKMTPDEKKAMLRKRRISWVYGNLALDNPNITREMVEKAAEEWL